MSRKNVYTTAGIILSFVIAIGGWALTSRLIEIKSKGLLSVTLSISTNTLDSASVNIKPNGESDNIPLNRSVLTDNEIIEILRNWGAVGRETPHEPTSEQLNMEQAIDSGREWLSFIDGLNIFPDELLRFNNVRAYLFQNLPLGQSGRFLPAAYSYWTVTFTNDLTSISMVINAVTGQVWKTDINILKFDVELNESDIKSALIAFASALELNYSGNGEILITPIQNGDSNKIVGGIVDDIQIMVATTRELETVSASYNFADGNAVTEVTAAGWRVEESKWSIGSFCMQLINKK